MIGGLAPDTGLELGLRIAGIPLRVRTNDEEVRQRLAAYFEAYVSPGAGPPAAEVQLVQGAAPVVGPVEDVRRPAGRKVKEAVREVEGGRIILKRQTGVVIRLWRGGALAVGDLRANLNQAINLINACYASAKLREGFVLFHASGVSWGGHAVALAGPPGAGKSTAALHLVEEGFRFLSNDRVLARPSGTGAEALGYPKQPRVNPGTLVHHRRLAGLLDAEDRTALLALGQAELWDLERKSDVDLDAIYGRGTVELAGSLRALVLLKWQRGRDGFVVRRLTAAGAMANLPLFQKDLGVFDLDRSPRPAAAVEHLERYSAVLERVHVLEVTGGIDLAAVVDLIGDLLGK
jgi:HprK-related kinase B